MMRTKMRTARRAARMFVLFKGTREPLLLGRWSSRASACANETWRHATRKETSKETSKENGKDKREGKEHSPTQEQENTVRTTRHGCSYGEEPFAYRRSFLPFCVCVATATEELSLLHIPIVTYPLLLEGGGGGLEPRKKGAGYDT
jgi:hypothetical protein